MPCSQDDYTSRRANRASLHSFLVALGLLATLGSQIGCNGPSAPSQDPDRDTVPATHPLTLGVAGDFSGPNELLASSQLDHEIRSNLFLHLVQEQPDYQESPPTFAPQLAESYHWSEDHLDLTFVLRDDVLWSDGVPVTANDVRWTWQAHISADVGWTYSFVKDSIKDVEVVDPHTVTFHFDRTYANQLLDANEGFILPKHAWSELAFAEWGGNAGWFQEHLVVAGPYTVDSWTPQQETILSANPNYFREGLPQLQKVVLRVLPEENTRWQQFLAGEVDFVRSVPADRVAEVESNPDLRIESIDSRQYNFIAWNSQRPLFEDPAVRRAITLAIDRQELVDTLYQGYATIASSPFPKTVWAHNATIAPWPYDPEEASRQLAALGWSDSDGDGVLNRDDLTFSFELSTNTGNQLRRDALLLIQKQLAQIGVEAKPTFLEIQALISGNTTHDFDASLGAWAIDTSLDISYAFHSTEADGGANYGSFSNPEADRLMNEISEVTEMREAKPLFDQLQEILHSEQPYTFLWEPPSLLGFNERVEGAHPNALLVLFDLEMWQLSP